MIDDIEKWLTMAATAVALLGSHFKLKGQVNTLEASDETRQQDIEKIENEVDRLKEDRTKMMTLLENVIRMQEETRLDVKTILQSIATLAANQGKTDE